MHSCTCTPDDCRSCDAQFVCRCLQVTQEHLVVTITTLGLRTLREVRQKTGAGDGCTACHRKLKSLLQEHAPVESETMCLVG